MNKMGVDLLGTFHLFEHSKRKNSLLKDYWCVANLIGDQYKDSCYLYFIDKEELKLGESCKVEFKYKFSDDDRFEKKVKVGATIELSEGGGTVGNLVVEKIINSKLIH